MLDRRFAAGGGPGVAHGVVTPVDVPQDRRQRTSNEENAKSAKCEEAVEDGKKIQIGDNLSTMDHIILCASEFAGTAILLLLGCMGCVTEITAGKSIPHEQISLTFGLAVMISVQIFGHVSGSHINPIVTVAAVALGNIPLIQLPIYFTGQLLGALAGYGLLKLATPAPFMGAFTSNVTGADIYVPGVCSPGINGSLSVYQGLLVEFLVSFILALVCCGIWDVRNKDKHDSVPIKLGLTIAILAMAAGPYTGANMNPVRSFAPALINGDWANHWVYWVGPLLGGLLAGLFYRFIFDKVESDVVHRNLPETLPLNDKV